MAHRADFIRLLALQAHGGLYLDMDTISLRPLASSLLTESTFVIAKQFHPGAYKHPPMCEARSDGTWACMSKRTDYGLCNAIMASSAHSPFVAHWLQHYDNFRSRGKDGHWAEHSVNLPARLFENCPAFRVHQVAVLDEEAFFPFYWDQAAALLLRKYERGEHLISKSYVAHLWGSGASAVSWSWAS